MAIQDYIKKIIIISFLGLAGCQSTSTNTGASVKPSDWDTEWVTIWKSFETKRGESQSIYTDKITTTMIKQNVTPDLSKESNSYILRSSSRLFDKRVSLLDISQCKEFEKSFFTEEYNDLPEERNFSTYIDVRSKGTAFIISRIRNISPQKNLEEIRCKFNYQKIENILKESTQQKVNKEVAKNTSKKNIERQKLAKQAEKEKALAKKRKANAHITAMNNAADAMATVSYCKNHLLVSNNTAKYYSKNLVDELKNEVGHKYDKKYLNDQYIKTKALLKYANYKVLSISCGAIQDEYDAKHGKAF